jgi:potassium-dependent mechanosensitive channel
VYVRWRATSLKHCLQNALGMLLAAALSVQISTAQTVGVIQPKPLSEPQASAVEPRPAPPPDLAIPLPAIADQAEQLDRTLQRISRDLSLEGAPGKTLGRAAPLSAQSIAVQTALINERGRLVEDFLDDSPDVVQVRDKIVYWRALNDQYVSEQKQLKMRAAELQTDILALDQEHARWQATREKIRDTAGIEVIAGRVERQLSAIRDMRSRTQDQLNQILTLENQLSQARGIISETLEKLGEAQKRFRAGLFQADSEPLWMARTSREPGQSLGAVLRDSADQDLTTAREFLRARAASAMLVLPILYLLALLCALRLKLAVAGTAGSALAPEGQEILRKPYSLSLLVTLVVAAYLLAGAPVGLALLFYSIWLGLVFRLTSFLIRPALHPLIYAILALNALEGVRATIPFAPYINRLLIDAILIGALATLLWLARPSRLRRLGLYGSSLRVLRAIVEIAILLFGIALLVNIFGFVSLSHLLGIGTLVSAFLAVVLYCVVRIILLLLALFLSSGWASSFSVAQRRSIELRTRRALIVVAALIWWSRSELYLFIFHDAFISVRSAVLAYKLGVGKIEITVGGIVGVALILAIGYVVAKGSSSLLQSVLTAKLPRDRGLPYAISRVTYYCLMLLVLVAAAGGAGVELDRFTLITGALGVGVGFGLQNIVSNFASGLILLLERPVRLGDTVEVNGLTGVIKQIGARASSISTAQGAEVIVPNSTLLSSHVVNWSISSPGRRVEIPVRVAYGADAETVLKLLIDVAAANANVMTEPPPKAFFLGFGESALNFELHVWTARQENWFQLKSDVGIGVSLALRDAGIAIPFPQRDLHLRSTDFAIVPSDGIAPTPSAPASHREDRPLTRKTD